jgi:hypothetical protein
MITNDAAEYCGFCYMARVPQYVVLHLLNNGYLSYSPAEQQEIREFVPNLPETSTSLNYVLYEPL